MNQDRIDGKAKEVGAQLKKIWARITDDDLKLFAANRDEFLGKLQNEYGIAKDEAKERIAEAEDAWDSSNKAA